MLLTCEHECSQIRKSESVVPEALAESRSFSFGGRMTIALPLVNGGVTLIDEEDAPLVIGRSWRINYVYYKGQRRRPGSVVSGTHKAGNLVILHRLLLAPCQGHVVDHIDGDPLNNRRSNLRVCSQGENTRNRKRASHNKAGVKGVYEDLSATKHLPPWRAQIRVNGVTHNLGRYRTKGEAAHAYELAAKKYHGEFARVD